MSSSPASRPPAPAEGSARLHVAVVCEEALEWSLFEALRALGGPRMTACSSLRQLVEVCGASEVNAAVVDLERCELGVSEAEGVGRLLGTDVRLVALTAQAMPASYRWQRDGQIRWIRQPASAEAVVQALTSERRGSSYVHVPGKSPDAG